LRSTLLSAAMFHQRSASKFSATGVWTQPAIFGQMTSGRQDDVGSVNTLHEGSQRGPAKNVLGIEEEEIPSQSELTCVRTRHGMACPANKPPTDKTCRSGSGKCQK